ncbi:MAG TPA: hypothetical protein VLA49_10710 [Anaerolineales bacterium]|nr:hypothetical protein [Anaerolineales bacterium]
MKKYNLACLLMVLVSLSIAACQEKRGSETEPAAPIATLGPPTITTQTETQPVPTEPTAAPGEPACFQSYIAPIAFMPDSSRILIRAEQGVQIYNLEIMEEESLLESPTRLNSPAVALSPDGERLAWALEDFSIQLIRLSDQEVLQTLSGHTAPVTELRFSPAGDRLYSASHDGWVRAWNMAGELVNAFQPGGGEILGLGISADGRTLATVSFDGPVKLWDAEGGQEVAELGGTGGYDTSEVAFSPDGRFVAADLATGLSVWQVGERALFWGGVNSMAFAFSPQGDILAYADIDENNDIILVSADGKETLNRLNGQKGPVFELVFSADGSFLAAGGVEIRIWRVEEGQLFLIGKSECP